MGTILSTIIGAILSAFFSYIIYVWFRIKNLKKCMKNNIKSKFILLNNNEYLNHGVYLSQLKYIRECLKILTDVYIRLSNECYILIGKENQYFVDIEQKFNYLNGELYIIDHFIDLLLEKENLNTENLKESYKIQKENLFNYNDILNDMQNISINSSISEIYLIYRKTFKNGNIPKEYNLI